MNNYPDPRVMRDITPDGAYLKLLRSVIDSGTRVGFNNNVGAGETVELRPTMITFPAKSKFITVRSAFNLAFAFAEVLWICSGQNDVEMLVHYNKKIADYSDDGITFNAPYGERIFRTFGDQFEIALNKLKKNMGTRQAVITIWDPIKDNEEGHKDYACNNLSQLLVRGNKLDWTQTMRSNDLLWGMPYNFVQFISLQQIMASLLGIEVGDYHHICNSSHIYFNMLDEARLALKTEPRYYWSNVLKCETDDYFGFRELLFLLTGIEKHLRTKPNYNFDPNHIQDPGWRDLISTLAVFNKIKHSKQDLSLLESAQVYLNSITRDSFEWGWTFEKLNKARGVLV